MAKRLLAVAVLVLAGCGEGLGTVGGDEGLLPDQGQAKQGEAWSTSDSPSIFASDLEYKLDALPMAGEAQTIPWAGSYWPVYEDSINYQWDGQNDSPSLKYQKAFGGTAVEDAVSRGHGIDSFTSQKECTESSVCDSTKGETCAKRRGAEKGRCIPTWWGICHAWGPASIMLPEPKRSVTKNGVTFKVQDLKALATLVHNSTRSRFVSLRCNTMPGAELALDAYGRVVANECRDTNAGTYHLLLANYLGIKRQAFVEDRTAAFEVWNQPLRGYRVTEKRVVTLAEANRLVGVTSQGGATVTKTGTVAKDAWAHQGGFAVQAGQAVKVVMTGSGDADLYVKFGAAPTTAAYDCRPYGGDSSETCELTAPAGATQVFVSVNGYAATSSFSLAITTGGSAPTAYTFNAAAKSFVHVKSEVDYISEASSETDGNLAASIDQYTRTDRYEYVLELDAAGKVLGGEWVGSSKTSHPDFLWLPTAVSSTSVAGGAIKYELVKALVMESVTEPGGTGATLDVTKTESGTAAKGEWKLYGPFDVAAGAELKAVMTGTGDADLYVKKGLKPTATSYDCRPYAGGSAESCTVAGGGPVYVAVNGYATTSTFSLTISYRGTATGPVTPPPAAFTHLNASGSVALGELKVFTLAVPAGKKLVVRTQAAADVDLYLQVNAAPTTSSYAARAYTASGNETLTYTATDAVTLHLGVHGYAASAFTLTTADN